MTLKLMFLFFTLCFVKYYSFFRDSLKWLGLKEIDVFLECMQDLWFHKPCSRGFSFTQVTFLLPHICGFMNASIFTWGKYMATVVQMSDLNSNEIELTFTRSTIGYMIMQLNCLKWVAFCWQLIVVKERPSREKGWTKYRLMVWHFLSHQLAFT